MYNSAVRFLSEVLPVDEPPPAKLDAASRPAADTIESAALVEWIWAECEASGAALSVAAEEKLGELVKKFETTYKIHQAYGPQFHAVDRAIYGDLNTYVRFGEILAARHAASGDLRPLNCLLKLLDITTPMIEEDAQGLGPRFRRLLALEANAIEALGAKMELAV